MNFLLALAVSVAGVAALYTYWRRSRERRWFAIAAGWLVVSLSAVLWVRFAGAEFGMAYVTMAVAFAAWGFIAFGREPRRSGERRAQQRITGTAPARAATMGTLARALVAIPLAGTVSVLASVVAVAALPWVAANRYVLAIMMAPIIWGALAMWVGMTARLGRAALLLAGVSTACAALLFVRWGGA